MTPPVIVVAFDAVGAEAPIGAVAHNVWVAVTAWNWTVWPAVQQAGIVATTQSYDTTLTGDTSTHRFAWTPKQVHYESLYGISDDDTGLYQTWTFAPADYTLRVPQHAIPVHMNLWLLQGNAPTDRQDVDITIAEFKFIPDCLFANGFDDAAVVCALN